MWFPGPTEWFTTFVTPAPKIGHLLLASLAPACLRCRGMKESKKCDGLGPKAMGNSRLSTYLEAKINYGKAPQKAEELVSTPKIFWRHREEGVALS